MSLEAGVLSPVHCLSLLVQIPKVIRQSLHWSMNDLGFKLYMFYKTFKDLYLKQ